MNRDESVQGWMDTIIPLLQQVLILEITEM